MPKLVNRAARRAEIVEAYLRVVSRVGVAGATSRALAAELGVATGAMWHYFDGFEELLREAFQRVVDATTERITESARGRSGLDALDAMVDAMVPHDDQTRDEAAVAVSFWGLMPARQDFREQMRLVEDHWVRLVSGYLREAVDNGELVPETPVFPLTGMTIAMFDALQLRSVQGGPLASPERARALVDQLLAPWRVGCSEARRGRR